MSCGCGGPCCGPKVVFDQICTVNSVGGSVDYYSRPEHEGGPLGGVDGFSIQAVITALAAGGSVTVEYETSLDSRYWAFERTLVAAQPLSLGVLQAMVTVDDVPMRTSMRGRLRVYTASGGMCAVKIYCNPKQKAVATPSAPNGMYRTRGGVLMPTPGGHTRDGVVVPMFDFFPTCTFTPGGPDDPCYWVNKNGGVGVPAQSYCIGMCTCQVAQKICNCQSEGWKDNHPDCYKPAIDGLGPCLANCFNCAQYPGGCDDPCPLWKEQCNKNAINDWPSIYAKHKWEVGGYVNAFKELMDRLSKCRDCPIVTPKNP